MPANGRRDLIRRLKVKTVPESQILKLLYHCKANGRRCWGHLTKGWMEKWKVAGHASLLECDAMSSHKQFLKFQRIRVPSQCWEVSHPRTQCHIQGHSAASKDTVPHPRTQCHTQGHGVTSKDTVSHPRTQRHIQGDNVTSKDTSHRRTRCHIQGHCVTSKETVSHTKDIVSHPRTPCRIQGQCHIQGHSVTSKDTVSHPRRHGRHSLILGI